MPANLTTSVHLSVESKTILRNCTGVIGSGTIFTATTFLQFGISDGSIDRGIELCDGVRRVLRCADTKPAASIVAQHEYVQRRDGRKRVQAFCIRHRKCAQFAVADVADALRDGDD